MLNVVFSLTVFGEDGATSGKVAKGGQVLPLVRILEEEKTYHHHTNKYQV